MARPKGALYDKYAENLVVKCEVKL
jgi:hypothetical protein